MSHWLIYNYDHSYDFQSHVGLCKYFTASAVVCLKWLSFLFCDFEIWHFSHIKNSLFRIPRGLQRYKNVCSNRLKSDTHTWEKHPRTLWCPLPVRTFGKSTNVWRRRSSWNPTGLACCLETSEEEQCGSPGVSVVNPIKLKPGHLHGRRCCFTTLWGNQTACRH